MEKYFEEVNANLKDSNHSFFNDVFYDQLPNHLIVLGSENSKLRDEIGWTTFSKLFQSKLFLKTARAKILEILLSDNYLFFEIEKGQSNSCVKRSFSVLAIADLLYGDGDFGPEFDEKILSCVNQKLRNYIANEKDFRGHVDGLGWVHAFAHTGDAFSAAVLHPNTADGDIIENLKSILSCIKSRDLDIFKWEENFRLGRPIGRMIDKIGVDSFLEVFWSEIPKNYMFDMAYAQNLLNTLRCSYLEIYWREPENKEKLNKLKVALGEA